jgi:galactose-1-phosphate uridylyltransferase
MPELRKDPVVGRWVIMATERGKRPSDFKPTRDQRKGPPCAFCPGMEQMTPPEVLAPVPPENAAEALREALALCESPSVPNVAKAS